MRVLLLVSLLSSACSWMTLDTPPAQPKRGEPVRCTDESDMPTLDAGMAIGLGVLALIFDGTAIANHDTASVLVAVGFDVATPLYAVSAVWGYRQLDRCKKLRYGGTPPVPTP